MTVYLPAFKIKRTNPDETTDELFYIGYSKNDNLRLGSERIRTLPFYEELGKRASVPVNIGIDDFNGELIGTESGHIITAEALRTHLKDTYNEITAIKKEIGTTLNSEKSDELDNILISCKTAYQDLFEAEINASQ